MYAPLLYVWAFLVDVGVCLTANEPMGLINSNSYYFTLKDIHSFEKEWMLTLVGVHCHTCIRSLDLPPP